MPVGTPTLGEADHDRVDPEGPKPIFATAQDELERRLLPRSSPDIGG
jgi:hypothetical protein